MSKKEKNTIDFAQESGDKTTLKNVKNTIENTKESGVRRIPKSGKKLILSLERKTMKNTVLVSMRIGERIPKKLETRLSKNMVENVIAVEKIYNNSSPLTMSIMTGHLTGKFTKVVDNYITDYPLILSVVDSKYYAGIAI